ncbi:branched-chain-amino-acid transaminase [Methylophaga sp.]|uniref:branched-chain-amino-acid transaminase n=1 Tax=Methylophaga sp. TaxID=2024840 RepID=UPI003A8E6E9F
MNSCFVWTDNELHQVSPSRSLSLLCHSLHYGNLVFEGIRFYSVGNEPHVFRLQEHLDRFYESANELRMNIQIQKKDLYDLCLDVIKKSSIKEGYLRPVAYLTDGLSGLGSDDVETNVSVIIWDWQNDTNSALETKSKRLLISTFIRLSKSHGIPHVKCSGNYLLSRMALLEAKSEQLDDAVLLDENGYITEGTAQNIFFVVGGNLYTPTTENCLDGITRNTLIDLAKQVGIKVIEEKLRLETLEASDEVFMTSTASEITPIVEIKVGPNKTHKFKVGKVTELLNSEFKRVVSSSDDKHMEWMTKV